MPNKSKPAKKDELADIKSRLDDVDIYLKKLDGVLEDVLDRFKTLDKEYASLSNTVTSVDNNMKKVNPRLGIV